MEAEVRPLPSPVPSTESIYNALSTYTFSQDPDFQAGLVSLTSDTNLHPAQLEETIFQAQCFYFARKYHLPPVNPDDYKSWLSSHSGNTQPSVQTPPQTELPTRAEEHPSHIAAQPLSEPETSISAHATSSPPQDGPPYPASFESIVDLITRNQPIPGIEEIPDTVLDASLSAPSQIARRKKPWETDDAMKDVEPVLGDAVKSSDGNATGVVGILQPIKKLHEGEGTNPGELQEVSCKNEESMAQNSIEQTELENATAE